MKNIHIFLVALAFGLVPSLANAQVYQKPNITVRGQCLKSVSPDRGSVTLTARTKDKDAGFAVQRSNEIYNQLLEKTKALKLKDAEFETSDFSVNEDIDWSNNKRKSVGFTARTSLEISTSELKRLGEVIKIGADLKLEEGGTLRLFVSDQRMKKEYDSCLEEATRNARIKAESIAKGGGIRLGKVLSITETGSEPMRPMPLMKALAEHDGARTATLASSEIMAKDAKISVTVDASFSID